jgi:hypothetical protein
MSKVASGAVDVYPVGVLADLLHVWGALRCKGMSEAWRLLRYRSRGWTRRSSWNGYLAEVEGVGHCGHGWTRRRALRSLERIVRTTHWARHNPCGTVRLTADVRRRYCVTCGVSSRYDWTRVETGGAS